MANLDSVNMANAIKTMYERRLLDRSLSRLVHNQFGRVANWKEYGNYELRRFESLPVVSVPLSEGNTPSEETQPTMTVINITPLWYGAWISYTDKLDVTNFDPVVSEVSSLLGEQVGLSFDTLTRDELFTSLTIDYAGTAAATSDCDTTNDLIDYEEIVTNQATLMENNARPFENGMYKLILHPQSYSALMRDTTFVAMLTREGGEKMRAGQIGSILQMDVLISSNAKKYAAGGAAGVDAYGALFLGQDAYAVAGFTGLTVDYNDGFGAGEYDNLTGQEIKPLEIKIKGLGETGMDPLDQRGTIGWKATHEEQILQSTHGIRHEHCV